MKAFRKTFIPSFVAALVLLTMALPPFQSKSQTSDHPTLLSTVTPIIPRRAIFAHVGGDVTLNLMINAEGTVTSAHVVEGHLFLRKATEEAVLRWRFGPGADERRLRLVFSYSILHWVGGFPTLATVPVSVQPYDLKLDSKLEAPPDTVSYIPSDFKEGVTHCKVHGTILRKDKVEINYGEVEYEDGYVKAMKRLFPNSNKDVEGGCVITDESPKYAEVLYCQKCRRAEAKWVKAH